VKSIWLKNPLANLGNGAGGRIVEVVGAGWQPAAPPDKVIEPSRHVVLSGLLNTHDLWATQH